MFLLVTYLCVVCPIYVLQGEDFEKLSIQRDIPDNQVMLSIPGDYSRKPPVQGSPAYTVSLKIHKFRQNKSIGVGVFFG